MGLPVDSITPERAQAVLDERFNVNCTGPHVFGAENPQCRDCRLCDAVLVSCENNLQVIDCFKSLLYVSWNGTNPVDH